MDWNECLFWYAQERGGTYFGMKEKGSDAALLLEHGKGPILICVQVTYSGQYGTHRDVTVRAGVELERPYTLRVKPQSALRGGVSMVLGSLERGVQAMGRKTELTPDYGAPEVTGSRGVKTDAPEFTRCVLQSRELKDCLSAWPDFWFQVGPSGDEGRAHMVEARVTLEQEGELADALFDRFGTSSEEAEGWADYQASGFREQLDALVELAKAARDAVTAWPMPMKMT